MATKKHWTHEEEENLKKMHQNGKTVEQMANALPKRSFNQIKAKMSRMGIPTKTPKKRETSVKKEKEEKDVKKQKVNTILQSMLNLPNEKEQSKKLNTEDDDLSDSEQPLILPHWTFMPGDGRFYICMIKPSGSKLMLQLNSTGDEVDITLSCDDIEDTKEFISKSLDLKKEYLNTLIQPFIEHSIIRPPHTLTNNPTIHAKEETKVLISFPIAQHMSGSTLIFE